MPSASFPSSQRARARVVALFAALVTLCLSGAAFAAPAPMCDEHAQSIAAPFPILPSDNGEARAGTPCEQRGSVELGRAPAPDPQQNPGASETFERVLPVAVFALPRDRGVQLAPREAERDSARPGFAQGVFRPPRAA